VVIVAVTLFLIGWRGDRLRSTATIASPVSREGAFLLNNLLFAGLAFIVLLGTVFPQLVEVFTGDKLSVRPPYFDRMAIPVGLGLLLLMAVAPVLPWHRTTAETVWRRLLLPAWVGTAAVVLAVAVGARGLAPLAAFGLAAFAGATACRHLVLSVRR